MKTTLSIILLFFVVINSYSQIPLKDGRVEYEFINNNIEMSKDIIYQKAKLAIVEAFRDAKEVIQIDDKENGEIVGKGLFYFYIKITGVQVRNTAKFTISISCRDNKYRIRIYDIHTYTGTDEHKFSIEEMIMKPDKSVNKKVLISFHDEMTSFLNSINSKITVIKNDDF